MGDPVSMALRISQYELAFRMQMSVPDCRTLKRSDEHHRDTGPEVKKPGNLRLQLRLLPDARPRGACDSCSFWPWAGSCSNLAETDQGTVLRFRL